MFSFAFDFLQYVVVNIDNVLWLFAAWCAVLVIRLKIDQRRATVELTKLHKEVFSDKVIDMDAAIEACRRLKEIEAKYGQDFRIQVLVKDSRGNPARLTLTAN